MMLDELKNEKKAETKIRKIKTNGIAFTRSSWTPDSQVT
jgi:hypothetical protein